MDIFNKQRDFFNSGETYPLAHRMEGLKRLEKALKENHQNICQALKDDLGKSALESEMGEISFVLDEIKRAKKNLKSWTKPQKVKTPLLLWPAKSTIAPFPVGIVLIISPWNYPLRLSLCPLVGAIAAGNCAFLHLSPQAPHTTRVIKDIIAKNFSPCQVATLSGEIREVEKLTTLPLGHIFFTGGAKVGRILAQNAAQNLIPITLELGGQNPAIVHYDAPLTLTAKRVAFGKFFNNGQTCVAPNSVFVHKKIAQTFIQKITQTLEDWGKKHSFGKIINEAHWDRLSKLLENQKIIYGGQKNREQLLMAPTIVHNPHWEDSLVEEEIFGPILLIKEYEDSQELFNTIRQKLSPLSSYLFTRDKKLKKSFLQTIPSGQSGLNDTLLQANNPHLPFGGVGKSGHGRYYGKESFLTFSNMKSILEKPFSLDIPLRYPPYTPQKKKWLRFFF